MPYVKQKMRDIAMEVGLNDLIMWIWTLPVERRKSAVAYCTMALGRHSFTQNYDGKSTGTDAVRSALDEMKLDLAKYEARKKEENGDV